MRNRESVANPIYRENSAELIRALVHETSHKTVKKIPAWYCVKSIRLKILRVKVCRSTFTLRPGQTLKICREYSLFVSRWSRLEIRVAM